MILERYANGDLVYWCPACSCRHFVSPWSWMPLGSLGDPTMTPGVIVINRDGTNLCHHVISQGWIYYLEDCTHAMRGLKVKMCDIEGHREPARVELPRLQASIHFAESR